MKYTPEMLEEAVVNSNSFSDVLRYLNAGLSGSNHGHIKRRIQKLEIDYSHFGDYKKRVIQSSKTRQTPDEILVLLPDSITKRPTRKQLLFAMLSKDVPYLCGMPGCQNPEPMWRGITLILEIDHVDGNWRNCTLENLRFTCPNCHTQTESNFRSRAVGPEEVQYIIDTLNGQPGVEPESSKARKKNKIIYDICACGGRKTKKAKKCIQCFDKKAPRGFTVKYPPVEDLVEEVKQTSYLAVGKRLGCSDNAVRKRIKIAGYDPKTLELLDKSNEPVV